MTSVSIDVNYGEWIYIFLALAVPIYSTVAAARAMGLFRVDSVMATNAVVWTFLLHALVYLTIFEMASGWEPIPYFLLGYFSLGLLPAIFCLGLKRWQTYVFALVGAVGATIPTAAMSVAMGSVDYVRL